jgi:8-oxo-dGTP pyrophosphatase MutT (NUDIX family)
MAKRVSCGVIVIDGSRILLGHATRSPRWDIPKGLAEPGENFVSAATRELSEETGLLARAFELRELGVYSYRSGKDLALFVWRPAQPVRPEALVCRSTFALRNGAEVPEFDKFGLFSWEEAMEKIGASLARIMRSVRGDALDPV